MFMSVILFTLCHYVYTCNKNIVPYRKDVVAVAKFALACHASQRRGTVFNPQSIQLVVPSIKELRCTQNNRKVKKTLFSLKKKIRNYFRVLSSKNLDDHQNYMYFILCVSTDYKGSLTDVEETIGMASR